MNTWRKCYICGSWGDYGWACKACHRRWLKSKTAPPWMTPPQQERTRLPSSPRHFLFVCPDPGQTKVPNSYPCRSKISSRWATESSPGWENAVRILEDG